MPAIHAQLSGESAASHSQIDIDLGPVAAMFTTPSIPPD